jgi:hypothetical protein
MNFREPQKKRHPIGLKVSSVSVSKVTQAASQSPPFANILPNSLHRRNQTLKSIKKIAKKLR